MSIEVDTGEIGGIVLETFKAFDGVRSAHIPRDAGDFLQYHFGNSGGPTATTHYCYLSCFHFIFEDMGEILRLLHRAIASLSCL